MQLTESVYYFVDFTPANQRVLRDVRADAGGGRVTLNTNLAIFGLMAMPLFLAISIVTMWLFFWMKMHRTALAFGSCR